mgnify:CR=1 FL=1
MSAEQAYIPFETTAKIIARGEEENAQFLQALLPDLPITNDQLYIFEYFIAGKIHDGIQYGLAMIGTDVDPIRPIEAYRLGFEHGKNEGVK